MKRTISLLLCLYLLTTISGLAFAADSVPNAIISDTKSVFRVFSSDGYSVASGTCFVIGNSSDKTFYATNNHVVSGMTYEIAIWIEEDLVYAKIEKTSADKDLCILSTERIYGLSPLTLTSNVSQGEAVYAIGFPGDSDYFSDSIPHLSSEATITDGIISSIREVTVNAGGSPVKLLQTNADITNGNSGGPLLNKHGEVVGINTYGVSAGINGAIGAEELIDFAKSYPISASSASSSDYRVILIGLACLFGIGLLFLLIIKMPDIIKDSSNKDPVTPVKKPIPVVQSLSAQHLRQSAQIGSTPSIIGRSSDCIIVFRDNTPGVSSKHCSIAYQPQYGFVLVDLQSTYGTYLQTGVKLIPNIPYYLKPGDYFYLGSRSNTIKVVFQ